MTRLYLHEDYKLPGHPFRPMIAGQAQKVFDNTAAAMKGVPMDLIRMQLDHCAEADPADTTGVVKAFNFT